MATTSNQDHENNDDDQDLSTGLLFGHIFRPIALHYKGVRVENAVMTGKSLTLLASAVFNSAFVVAEWIDRGFLQFANGKTVLELGAGTGMPTLRLLKEPSISVKRATITDYPAEEIMVTLRKNAVVNGALDVPGVHVAGLDWANEQNIQDVLLLNNGQAYDLIIAADLLWYTDAHESLVDCISKTLRKPTSEDGPDGVPRAIVPSGTYAKREDVRRFLALVAEAGLKWREMQLDTPFVDEPVWETELTDIPKYEWYGTLDIFWEGEDNTREDATATNLAERKNLVYAFELQWA